MVHVLLTERLHVQISQLDLHHSICPHVLWEIQTSHFFCPWIQISKFVWIFNCVNLRRALVALALSFCRQTFVWFTLITSPTWHSMQHTQFPDQRDNNWPSFYRVTRANLLFRSGSPKGLNEWTSQYPSQDIWWLLPRHLVPNLYPFSTIWSFVTHIKHIDLNQGKLKNQNKTIKIVLAKRNKEKSKEKTRETPKRVLPVNFSCFVFSLSRDETKKKYGVYYQNRMVKRQLVRPLF